MNKAWTHLDNVWGVAGGLRPVESITKQMEMLLKEYLNSRDSKEAQRCIISLEVPHFHHELIYEVSSHWGFLNDVSFERSSALQAVLLTLENLNESCEEAMAQLFKSLETACIVTLEMIEQGFQRVYDDLQDIQLDIPLAHTVLERFVNRCYNLGVLSERMLKSLPTR